MSFTRSDFDSQVSEYRTGASGTATESEREKSWKAIRSCGALQDKHCCAKLAGIWVA